MQNDILKYSEPYIPKVSRNLILSGWKTTPFGGKTVEWKAIDPKSHFSYANRVYYETGKDNGLRGRYWVERMWADKSAIITKHVNEAVNRPAYAANLISKSEVYKREQIAKLTRELSEYLK